MSKAEYDRMFTKIVNKGDIDRVVFEVFKEMRDRGVNWTCDDRMCLLEAIQDVFDGSPSPQNVTVVPFRSKP